MLLGIYSESCSEICGLLAAALIIFLCFSSTEQCGSRQSTCRSGFVDTTLEAVATFRTKVILYYMISPLVVGMKIAMQRCSNNSDYISANISQIERSAVKIRLFCFDVNCMHNT